MEEKIQQLQFSVIQIEAQMYRLIEQRIGLMNQLGVLREFNAAQKANESPLGVIPE